VGTATRLVDELADTPSIGGNRWCSTGWLRGQLHEGGRRNSGATRRANGLHKRCKSISWFARLARRYSLDIINVAEKLVLEEK